MKRSNRSSLALVALLACVAGKASAWEDPPKKLADNDPLLKSTDQINTEERKVYRNRIVEEALADAKESAKTKTHLVPIFFVMGGGGASGKGVVKEALIQQGRIKTANSVSIDPDELKNEIPEYRQVILKGDGRAAAVAHEESSNLAKAILAKAFAEKYNIVMDVTLGNPVKGLQQIDAAKKNGYKVILIGVTVDPALAVTRAVDRAKRTGRWVPREMLLDAHKGFSDGFVEYSKKADQVFLYDTTKADSSAGIAPVLVAIKEEGKQLEIKDKAAWASFEKKKTINVHATKPEELYKK